VRIELRNHATAPPNPPPTIPFGRPHVCFCKRRNGCANRGCRQINSDALVYRARRRSAPQRTDLVCLLRGVNLGGDDSLAVGLDVAQTRTASRLGNATHHPRRPTAWQTGYRALANHVAYGFRSAGPPSTPLQGRKKIRAEWSRAAYEPILHIAHFLCIGVFADLPRARYSAIRQMTDATAPIGEDGYGADTAAADVPIIYTPIVRPQTVTFTTRLTALAVALLALAPLVVGLNIAPASAGVGTHRSMGFQRCEFLARTKLPCPSCGMTTSFAHFSRGNWLASFYVQPGGFALALTCGALFWASLYMFITGRPIHRLTGQLPGFKAVPIVLGFFIAAWAWKIFIHLKGIDGWR
jgi:hypothetical protein